VIPSRQVVIALVNSTARRYAVAAGDLYGPQEIAEELIKEVMDSSFISSAKKAEHCAQLATLFQGAPAETIEETTVRVAAAESVSHTISEYRRRTTTMVSMMAGILTATMTLMVSFMQISKVNIKGPFEILFPTVVALLSIIVTMYAYLIFRQSQRRRMEQQDKFHTATAKDESRERSNKSRRTRHKPAAPLSFNVIEKMDRGI
jgi:uncharacterized membrane protein